MNTRLLSIVLSVAVIVLITAVSVTNTTNAASHVGGGESASTMTENSNATTIITTGEGEESINSTSTVVCDSLFAYLDERVLPSNDFIYISMIQRLTR